MTLLSYLDSPQPNQNFVLLQSSVSQSSLPLLRRVLVQNDGQNLKEPTTKLLFCFLHPPSSLVRNTPENVEIHDFLDRVLGFYSDPWSDPCPEILRIVENGLLHPLHPAEVMIDSVDTLLDDNGSIPEVYKFLQSLLALISARSKPSRLILHLTKPSALLPLLLNTTFSPTLIHLIAHPPVLFTHLATEYMTPPPPLSFDAKFWGVFIPFSERGRDVEELVFGQGGEGSGGSEEMVVEVLVRGRSDTSGRRKAVERFLEGWDIVKGTSMELSRLSSLASIWTRQKAVGKEAAPDPTQNVTFNLHLTPSQQESRARVPLPYAHEGLSTGQTTPGAILYDPDSADDIDDDDPDEDLDI
ncbi:hypothetical protein EV360DRAFT_34751 [Lentinula raphanica]|nr:hypothetical protein EV360DRAFT_34751 [Lentinula raphanica]